MLPGHLAAAGRFAGRGPRSVTGAAMAWLAQSLRSAVVGGNRPGGPGGSGRLFGYGEGFDEAVELGRCLPVVVDAQSPLRGDPGPIRGAAATATPLVMSQNQAAAMTKVAALTYATALGWLPDLVACCRSSVCVGIPSSLRANGSTVGKRRQEPLRGCLWYLAQG